MTEENYQYRTSQTMFRNLFPGPGEWKIPVIPKFEEKPGDFDDLLLIGFDKTHVQDERHLNRMVHFFLYDYRFDTKIGEDGRATIERHYTNHNCGDKHSNPHDHIIEWIDPPGYPKPGSPINYPKDQYPDGAPELKKYGGFFVMKHTIVPANSIEQNRFITISDFKQCIDRGGEVEFVWNGVHYGVIRYGTDNKITIYVANRPETEKVCETADDALEYMVGQDRLRDVITRVTVLDRTI